MWRKINTNRFNLTETFVYFRLGAISAFFYNHDTIPLKNDNYPIFYKNAKKFFSIFHFWRV